MPERTLRYRTRRLTQLRLLGRTRPYRERGSAPHHFWPTRHADALMRGEPPPRGGERRAPNPLFLAHAAAITELYVTLRTAPPSGFTLKELLREGEAREPFTDPVGQERAIAPDATFVLAGFDGVELCAFVELDRGSMSSGRLWTKARGYAEFYAANGWRERFSYCPPLLFLTTTAARARAFRSLPRRALKDVHLPSGDPFVAAVCGEVPTPGRAFYQTRLDDARRRGRASVVDVMRAARRPYDELRARVACGGRGARGAAERPARAARAPGIGVTREPALRLRRDRPARSSCCFARTEPDTAGADRRRRAGRLGRGPIDVSALESDQRGAALAGAARGRARGEQPVALDRLADRHGDCPAPRAAARPRRPPGAVLRGPSCARPRCRRSATRRSRAEHGGAGEPLPSGAARRAAREIVKARGLSAAAARDRTGPARGRRQAAVPLHAV